jgi:thiosulfate/3-mercaptopyruvate sulfurtransferase
MRTKRLLLVFLCLLPPCLGSAAGQTSASGELAPGSTALIKPEELAKAVQSQGAKPLILNVGPRFLYVQGHIPGAEYVGATWERQAIEKLRERVKPLPRHRAIVIYCGCCPWEHCPNVLPAYKELRDLGFTNLKVLFIADSFGADWVDKGYPVAKGE